MVVTGGIVGIISTDIEIRPCISMHVEVTSCKCLWNLDKIGELKMVKHVILWTLKDELSSSEKEEIKKNIKEGLEGLKGKVPGIVDIKVYIDCLASSNADLMLDSSFESEDALKNYAVHPEHVAVADSKVRPYTKLRSCLDFEV